MRLYGLTNEEHAAMLTASNGKCEICGAAHGKNGERLVVDHCHQRMCVRGILCRECNSALGMMQDSPDVLRSAIKYLEENRGESV